MRTRGLSALVVVTVGGALLAAAGCAPATDGPPPRFAAAPSSAPAPVPAAATPAPPGSPTRPANTPVRRSATPGSRANSGWPPYCQLSDVRFAISAATGGDNYQWFGSVMVTNVSGRTCAVSNYLILRWRDARGAVLPVTVTRIAGPVPPDVFLALKPGTRGIAGIRWQKYKEFNSTETCPPFAVTLDIWLGSTVEDPHPERRPPAQVPWFTGTTGSICAGSVKLQPLERMP